MSAENDSYPGFARAVGIMRRLRAPDGCPWDREQSFDTIRKFTLEETYEVLDAIERRDWPALKDELGDLLLQVLFYSQMADEAGYFTIDDVTENLGQKLVRRHPHVFGEEAAREAGNRASGLEMDGIGAGEVLRNWEAIKKLEKSARPANDSYLDEVPRSMPALAEAAKLGSRAAKVGFDWPDVTGLMAKLREEIAELEAEMKADKASRETAEELGDLLFTAVNLARHLKVDSEMALRDTNAKFRRRFSSMEQIHQQPLDGLSADELEALWIRAKQRERAS
ncbi:nucleoside triphosphate pyrophosphohydrolase [Silvibacterium acidisoli]|uniref:nucleoside triphosphate pyrophosphohydrolase n=1 Tax=Acidobacteriaceae bacterium ZG23-2 TaxID=2883246 RepID=UPI00406CD5B0